MESSSWNLSAPSMRHQTTLQSRFDMEFEEYEEVEEEVVSIEFSCPFCDEDYDIVELCYHIDEEHPDEAKYGICPVCAAGVGTDMVNHMTTQHANIFKMQHKVKLPRGTSESYATLSLLRKELGDGNLQSLIEGLNYTIASNTSPDPLLSSFVTNLPLHDPHKDEKPVPLGDGIVVNEASVETSNDSIPSAISGEHQEESARRSEFVQGLMLSTIFDDIL